jgi:hypothetical protein
MANTLKAGDRVLYSVNGTLYNALVLGATEGRHSGTGNFGTHLKIVYVDPQGVPALPTILTGISELADGKKTGFVVEPVTEIPLDDWKSAVAHSGPMGGEVVSIEAGAANMQRTDPSASDLDAIADEQKAAIATDTSQASIDGYIESQVAGDDFPEPHMEAPAAT